MRDCASSATPATAAPAAASTQALDEPATSAIMCDAVSTLVDMMFSWAVVHAWVASRCVGLGCTWFLPFGWRHAVLAPELRPEVVRQQ